MKKTTDYVALANEIFDSSINPLHIPQLLEQYSAESTDEGVFFFVKVIKALTDNKRHRNFLNRVNTHRLKSEVDGEVLYFDINASENNPIMIIGPKGNKGEQILNELADVKRGKGEFQSDISVYSLCDTLLSEWGIQVILKARHFANEHGFSLITSDYNVGQTIHKDDIILTIEKLDIASPTMNYIQKLTAAALFCNEMIKQLEIKAALKRPKSDNKFKFPTFDPTTTLDKIWLKDLKKYDGLIKKLKNEYRGTGQAFVIENDCKLQWNISLRGSQKYLMGLLYALHEFKCINIAKYKDVHLITICRNTFNLEKIDPGNFPIMRGGKIGRDYEFPFVELLKNL